MQNFFRRIDEVAGLQTESRLVLWLERATFIFLILMTVSAPHSIAATQTAWLLGMLAWTVRLFVKPRRLFKISLLDGALWAFFAWSVVSAAFSYAPDISLGKLRGASLFLIFYFVYNNLHTRHAARFVAGALIFSAMAAVLWTPLERIWGRGVQIYDFAGSAFDEIGLREGDVIMTIDGARVNSLSEAQRKIMENPSAPLFKMVIQREGVHMPVEVSRARIKAAPTAEESLGVRRWSRGRNWRAAGFYGHYTTFAEVMQMIMSLAFGIFIALISTHKFFAAGRAEREIEENQRLKTEDRFFGFLPFSLPALLLFCLAGMAFALLLTATRASQLAFLISAFAIVLLGGKRKIILPLVVIVVPLAIGGLLFLQNMRRVGFFDFRDSSINWRQTVYREGFELWTANARHFVFGVGMDSIKRYAGEWHLFDDGRLPMGHFHSTPLQLLVERGLPALLLWLTVLGIYARTLWRDLKFKARNGEPTEIGNRQAQIEKGIVLGCLGGAIGFFASSLVHYNLGDGEVAMVFYLLMGVGVFVGESEKRN